MASFGQSTTVSQGTSSTDQQNTSTGQGTSLSFNLNSPQSDFNLALAKAISDLANNQYQWAGSNYGNLQTMANNAIGDYLSAGAQANDLGTQMLNQYTTMYAPAAAEFNQTANTWASPGRTAQNMGAAEATASEAAQQGWQNTKQQLQAAGIDPSSGEYAGLEAAANTAAGASMAGAGNQAQQATQAQGLQLQQQNVNFGQQVPAGVLNAINQRYGADAGAVNTAESAMNTGVNAYNEANQFYQNAMGVKLPSVGTTAQNTNSSQGTTTTRQQNTSNSQQTQGSTDPSNNNSSGTPDNSNQTGSGPGNGGPQPTQQGGGGGGSGGGGSGGGGSGGGGSGGGGSGPQPSLPGNGPDVPAPGQPNSGTPDLGNSSFMQGVFDATRAELSPTASDTLGVGSGSGTTSPEFGGPPPIANAPPSMPSGGMAEGGVVGIDNYRRGGTVHRPHVTHPPKSGGGGINGGIPHLTANPDGTYSPGDQAPLAPPNVDNRSPFSNVAPGGGTNLSNPAPSAPPGGAIPAPPMASGGAVDPYHVHGLPDATSGGHIPYGISPSHGHVVDDVVANLNAGEFVFPRDVTQHYGHKQLYKMIKDARKESHQQAGDARNPMPSKGSSDAGSKQNFNMGGAI